MLLCPWDFQGKNTGVHWYFLLQGNVPMQGLKLHLQHWQTDSLPLNHLGSPCVMFIDNIIFTVNSSCDTHIILSLCYCVVFNCVWFFVTPWIVVCWVTLSMGFLKQEYWRGLPFPFLEDLPNPGIRSMSPAVQILYLWATRKAPKVHLIPS